jgi:CubicO group peptidase (beta-lactamase class C family)
LLLAKGFGYADLENDVPATAETVYRIGSITKQFTAVCILQLREQGKLDLNDELTKFLPDYPTQGRRVTVHHLLNHTSGIKSYTNLGPKWMKTVPNDLSHDELLSFFKNEPFEFSPGQNFAYNNLGYFLLGLIIEQVTGQSVVYQVWLPVILREHIFEPLGMESSCYCENRPLIKHRAEGYQRSKGKLENDELISMAHPYAAGALCSTVLDLVKWQRALVEYRLINDESFELMTTPTFLPSLASTHYGYGLFVGELEGHPCFKHGGGIPGFSTQLAYYPNDDLTVVVLMNTEGPEPEILEERIARFALGLPDRVPKPQNVPFRSGDADGG